MQSRKSVLIVAITAIGVLCTSCEPKNPTPEKPFSRFPTQSIKYDGDNVPISKEINTIDCTGAITCKTLYSYDVSSSEYTPTGKILYYVLDGKDTTETFTYLNNNYVIESKNESYSELNHIYLDIYTSDDHISYILNQRMETILDNNYQTKEVITYLRNGSGSLYKYLNVEYFYDEFGKNTSTLSHYRNTSEKITSTSKVEYFYNPDGQTSYELHSEKAAGLLDYTPTSQTIYSYDNLNLVKSVYYQYYSKGYHKSSQYEVFLDEQFHKKNGTTFYYNDGTVNYMIVNETILEDNVRTLITYRGKALQALTPTNRTTNTLDNYSRTTKEVRESYNEGYYVTETTINKY